MVVISNGFSKFHLSVAAAEASRRKILSSFLTGAYPTPSVRRLLSCRLVRSHAKVKRLAARREEIPDSLVHPLFVAEAAHAFGTLTNCEAANIGSMKFYGWQAGRYVEQAAEEGARIYHYRAGFGGESVEIAKKHNMFALCDHSIAHPLLVEALVQNNGRILCREGMGRPTPFWLHILRDIERADAVLVNSRFVEESFRHAGHTRTPVKVIYLGVDDSFLDHVPPRDDSSSDFRMLFAGAFVKRKGVDTLAEALRDLDSLPWRLEIAAVIEPQEAARREGLLSDLRVRQLGLLSRTDLALAMARAKVFVFPSLAEGSARVVFEALACGCYVITTPNSGSIVEDGVHGSIVTPGDSAALAGAIEYAFHHPDLVSEIGRRNARLVQERYKQSAYGDALFRLYRQVQPS